MIKRAIFFVDANNWYHNIKKFFNPSEVDIKKVAELIYKNLNYWLIDIYWYASVPGIEDGENMYYQHISFLSHLAERGIKVITRKLQKLSVKEILKKKKETIESLDLCETCKPLVESHFLDLVSIKKKEKGIDVWIAIDMIKKSLIDRECDVCVLISGDADFVPALNLIKENRKEVLSAFVSFGYAFELRKKFPYFIIRKETLLKCLRDYKNKKQEKK